MLRHSHSFSANSGKNKKQRPTSAHSTFGWSHHKENKALKFKDDITLDLDPRHPSEEFVSFNNFTASDVYNFEEFVNGAIELMEYSSAIAPRKGSKAQDKKSEGAGHRSRKAQKRQTWQSYLRIESMLEGFFRCLKGHQKHQLCQPTPTGDGVIPRGHAEMIPVKHLERHRNPADKFLEHRLKQELEQKNRKIQALQKAVDDYTKKLSSVMSKVVSADETSIENISIKDRPMNVAQEYELIQSNEWLSAKTVLDDMRSKYSEPEMLFLLCDVIEVARATASRLQKSVMVNVKRAILTVCSPENLYQNNTEGHDSALHRVGFVKGKSIRKSYTVKEESTQPLPTEVTNFFGDYLRIYCNIANLDGMCQEVISNLESSRERQYLLRQNTWKIFKETPAFQSYLQAVCRITWKMSIQRPPMMLDFAAVRRSDREQDLHWNSQIADGAKVCVVFPILTHGNQVMAKGKIFLYVPQ